MDGIQLTGQADQRTQKHVEFEHRIRTLSLRLAPLVQAASGRKHVSFPRTLLNYHLLTASELDELASFYNQRTPGPYTWTYPLCVCVGREKWLSLSVDSKRRKLGRFIGLHGCETPLISGIEPSIPVQMVTEESIWAEARRAQEREEEREIWKRKRGF